MVQIKSVSGIGEGITDAIRERSQITVALDSIKIHLKDARSYEKILCTPELARQVNESKTRLYINAKLNAAIEELTAIEPLCQKYYELFYRQFEELKTAVQKRVSKQPLTKQY